MSVTMLDWLQVRGRECLAALQVQAHKDCGVPDTPFQSGKIRLAQFPAFALTRIAELQARCDALEAQVSAMTETKH